MQIYLTEEEQKYMVNILMDKLNCSKYCRESNDHNISMLNRLINRLGCNNELKDEFDAMMWKWRN